MLDINLIRTNPDEVRAGVEKKGVDSKLVDKVLRADEEWREKVVALEGMKTEQNFLSKDMAKEQTEGSIAKASVLKKRVAEMQEEVNELKTKRDEILNRLPNLPLKDVLVGKDDSENKVARKIGEPKNFEFELKDYMALGEALDIIDTERASKVSGSRFGYLKGDGALLEFALVQYVLNKLTAKGFKPVVPPVMIKPEMMAAMGYMDAHGDEIYQLKDDPLVLVGTSEQSVGAMHADETLAVEHEPIRYVAFSTCFRREAGSYGKDTKGILRVHQFDKLEMFSFVKPEDSEKEHEFLLACEEELLGGLGLPYQVLDICSGDLGTPAARKWDLETWVPSQKTYRETHSTSNCTDFQARRLNIGWKNPTTKKRELVHTLNGTAFAIGRAIIAILENYQNADGSVTIPEALRSYMMGKEKIVKN
jgi:seryl-tRNA synthetase